ncbi:MAG: hypothetical protein JWQ38_2490 [Flavipsychrobacter sp.]|nr:hypothetical protein [Flavipsychrobacter sp.]
MHDPIMYIVLYTCKVKCYPMSSMLILVMPIGSSEYSCKTNKDNDNSGACKAKQYIGK